MYADMMYVLDANEHGFHYNIRDLQQMTLNNSRLNVALSGNQDYRQLIFPIEIKEPIKKIKLPLHSWGVYLGNKTQIESIEIPSLQVVKVLNNSYIRNIETTYNQQFINRFTIHQCPSLKNIPFNIKYLSCDKGIVKSKHLKKCEMINIMY